MRLRPKKHEPQVPDVSEAIQQAAQDQFELVKLIMQYAILEQKVKPLVPRASQKLVRDLLDSGCSAKTMGKLVGRSPGYIQAVAKGTKSLGAQPFVVLVRHAMSSGANNAARTE